MHGGSGAVGEYATVFRQDRMKRSRQREVERRQRETEAAAERSGGGPEAGTVIFRFF